MIPAFKFLNREESNLYLTHFGALVTKNPHMTRDELDRQAWESVSAYRARCQLEPSLETNTVVKGVPKDMEFTLTFKPKKTKLTRDE
jgi:hypothetical protein